jgi:hypothetical protein
MHVHSLRELGLLVHHPSGQMHLYLNPARAVMKEDVLATVRESDNGACYFPPDVAVHRDAPFLGKTAPAGHTANCFDRNVRPDSDLI